MFLENKVGVFGMLMIGCRLQTLITISYYKDESFLICTTKLIISTEPTAQSSHNKVIELSLRVITGPI